MVAKAVYPDLDSKRAEISKMLNPKRKAEFGQFLTPNSIASFMASLFTYSKNIKLIDPGAGIGSLTSAFLKKAQMSDSRISVDTWEIDPLLRIHLKETLDYWSFMSNGKVSFLINDDDFISNAWFLLKMGSDNQYTHAIINPPYKKLKSSSNYKTILRSVGIDTVNLYTAFIALTIELLANGGELVAIIPRSFCNGTYYLPFREFLLKKMSIKQIHLFESRSSAFGDDEVLQENIIIHMVKDLSLKRTIVSTSFDQSFEDYSETVYDSEVISNLADTNMFIRIPLSNGNNSSSFPNSVTLASLGIEVSTGPVVDFRVKEYLNNVFDSDTVPLLYPFNLTQGFLEWPKVHKKANGIKLCEQTNKLLFPAGNYVLVKRFSSKEEKKRIVASFLSSADLDYSFIGIENHLNVFHIQKNGLSELIGKGLTVYLNSSFIDGYFRTFSGHTQVNATDLRSLPYPSIEQLVDIGRKYEVCLNNQMLIDSSVQGVING